MIHFGKISAREFLANYWQKKPLLIKQALPNFISPITPDELAGLSLEEEFESRLITGSTIDNNWSLTNGPFAEDSFSQLPDQDWTLLVQGVDRFIPEVSNLIKHFDFIPRWRFDDVMISYAAKGGSVGPHFDYYDVFLLQGSGKRRWHLSSKHCEMDNYLDDVPLRIMDIFKSEQVFDVEPGDVLYIPPKVAHHGVSLDDDCMTLSFGYRSYTGQEIFGGDCPNSIKNLYYQDPIWENDNSTAYIPDTAWKMANNMTKITKEKFAKFVTKLDTLDQKILQDFEFEQQQLHFSDQISYQLHAVCKIAYIEDKNIIRFFINGDEFIPQDKPEAMIKFCNMRQIDAKKHPQLAQALFEANLISPST